MLECTIWLIQYHNRRCSYKQMSNILLNSHPMPCKVNIYIYSRTAHAASGLCTSNMILYIYNTNNTWRSTIAMNILLKTRTASYFLSISCSSQPRDVCISSKNIILPPNGILECWLGRKRRRKPFGMWLVEYAGEKITRPKFCSVYFISNYIFQLERDRDIVQNKL